LSERFLRRLEHGLDIMSNAGELSVLIVSVSGLGIVNEAHGPEVGDALLVAFARKLESLLPSTSRLGRLGSDQFGVLVPECPARIAVEISEQLQLAFEEPLNITSHMLSVSPNIGIATYPSDSTTATGLLRCAELAARHARRNNVRSRAPAGHGDAVASGHSPWRAGNHLRTNSLCGDRQACVL